ncbi:MAG: hypothetical protein AB1486_02500 [Planctomycetota bacterium]
MSWREYRNTRRLWETWGPVAGSPWEPFHCVTLFAALDRPALVKPGSKVGPLADTDVPAHLRPPAELPSWASAETLVLVDLPGPRVVSVGYHLAVTGGFQPVCTFDNWPHTLGVVRSEKILGALLYFAAGMSKVWEKLPRSAPPMWLLDADRLRGQKPPPGRFDNRYFIEDRLLPGPALLSTAGIRRVIYVSAGLPASVSLDLWQYLSVLVRSGIQVATVSTATVEAWSQSVPYVAEPESKTTLWSMHVTRSSAGGFGGFVPTPSSGG